MTAVVNYWVKFFSQQRSVLIVWYVVVVFFHNKTSFVREKCISSTEGFSLNNVHMYSFCCF
jgi:hypothetical protein